MREPGSGQGLPRRTFLAAAAVTGFLGNAARAAPPRDAALAELGLVAVRDRIAAGDVTAERYVTTLIERATRADALHAFAHRDFPRLLAQARDVDRDRAAGRRLPAWAGVPILIKDNIDTVGFATTAGTPGLATDRPRRDAPVVTRLAAQGALVFAKTNMHELAAGVTSTNRTFGAVRNPYDLARIPGGSSGGTAAALAARLAPAGLGTDTGGSARMPAAYCGVVGFRPSAFGAHKRYPEGGVVPLLADLDTIGPMARSVEDVAALDAAISGAVPAPAVALRGLRLGIPRTTHWTDLDAATAKAAERALDRLRDAGVVLVEIDLRATVAQASAVIGVLYQTFRTDLAAFLAARATPIDIAAVAAASPDEGLRARLGAETALDTKALTHARAELQPALVREYRRVLAAARTSAIVFPTCPLVPPAIRAGGDRPGDTVMLNGVARDAIFTVARNCLPTCALGAPGLSLPAGLDDAGLPSGIEIDGLPGQDATLLALGRAIERVLPATPPPPTRWLR